MLRRIFQQHSKNLSSGYRLRPSLRTFSSDVSDGFDEKDLASDYQTTSRTLSHARNVLDSVSRDVIDKKTEHLATKESISTMQSSILSAINESEKRTRADFEKNLEKTRADFHQTQSTHLRWMFGSVALGGVGLAYRAGLFDSNDKTGSKLKPG